MLIINSQRKRGLILAWPSGELELNYTSLYNVYDFGPDNEDSDTHTEQERNLMEMTDQAQFS